MFFCHQVSFAKHTGSRGILEGSLKLAMCSKFVSVIEGIDYVHTYIYIYYTHIYNIYIHANIKYTHVYIMYTLYIYNYVYIDVYIYMGRIHVHLL